jgi:adenylate cyclase
MPLEIERKFLVKKEVWNKSQKGKGNYYRQGYLLTEAEKTIRVRATDTEGFITIKGKSTGATRLEYEYPIPREEAIELLDNFAISNIIKWRFKVDFEGKIWEIDEFLGENEGLIIAEIELKSEDETFEIPHWIADEVTGDARYFNSALSILPFKKW